MKIHKTTTKKKTTTTMKTDKCCCLRCISVDFFVFSLETMSSSYHLSMGAATYTYIPMYKLVATAAAAFLLSLPFLLIEICYMKTHDFISSVYKTELEKKLLSDDQQMSCGD